MDDEHLHTSLKTMPGSTENMPNRAIWHLRGSLDENASFFFTVSYFQADFTVQAFSTVVSALVATIKTAKIRL